MPTTTPATPATAAPAAGSPPEVSGALATAACLIVAAALVHAAGAADVRVVVAGADVTIQIPPGAGDQPGREAAVAGYARILGAAVTRRHDRLRHQAWTETRGRLGSHRIHVWSITDPTGEA
jgi:hypothetical protein